MIRIWKLFDTNVKNCHFFIYKIKNLDKNDLQYCSLIFDLEK